MRFALLLAALLACSACDVLEQPSGLIPRWTSAWHDVATPEDRLRLAGWRTSFVDALTAARKSGHGAEIDAAGSLLNPDAALATPAIPDGTYRCRVIKLGATSSGARDYFAYPPSICRISADRQLQKFAQLSGPQRVLGLIFPGDPLRQVFLGTLVLGDETRSLQYSQDSTRDVAAYIERIGDRHWRMILPQPHFESKFDVMELTPLQ